MKLTTETKHVIGLIIFVYVMILVPVVILSFLFYFDMGKRERCPEPNSIIGYITAPIWKVGCELAEPRFNLNEVKNEAN